MGAMAGPVVFALLCVLALLITRGLLAALSPQAIQTIHHAAGVAMASRRA
jgi:hypothetical protein